MKHYTVVLFFLILSSYTYAQNILNGVVVDAENNGPIAYVSIGITRIPHGTISDTQGSFKLSLDKVTESDTLKFSSIGYESKDFLILQLKERMRNGALVISLTKSVTEIKPVSILAQKAHVKIVGYDKNSRLFGLGFDSSGVGSEAGITIPITHKETALQNLSFFIIQNPFKHLVFRINLYGIINDQPGKNSLTQNIIINIDDYQTGKMIFDLSKYNIYLNSNALVTLEWIDAQPMIKQKIAVAAALFGHTYYRQASQSAWVKKGTGIGLSVKTIY